MPLPPIIWSGLLPLSSGRLLSLHPLTLAFGGHHTVNSSTSILISVEAMETSARLAPVQRRRRRCPAASSSSDTELRVFTYFVGAICAAANVTLNTVKLWNLLKLYDSTPLAHACGLFILPLPLPQDQKP